MVVEETPVCDVVVDETPISDIVVEQPEIISLGTCKVTAYCCENYPHICNDGDSTTTATGTTPTAGRTVAVDPKTIPYGSEVIIDGHTYIAEDCGGAIQGNRVDIVFATHDEALNFGVQYIEVSYIKQ
jgi:3D (Asp-Asp-Asp) domain-containing protein